MGYKNPEEKRIRVRNYIRDNPNCTYLDIKRATKVKIERIYKNMREAYKDANVKLSENLTKNNRIQQKEAIIGYIKTHPGCKIKEIEKVTKAHLIRSFKGIKEAYKSANMPYPKREIKDGVMNPDVIKRCLDFEKRIISLLENFGEVKPKIRTNAGIIDCLFNYKYKTFLVEIKDYRSRNNITMHEIKQLLRYMISLKIKDGILICPKESFPKRKNSRNIYIDGLRIKILSEEDIRGRSIKEILLSVQPG